MVDFMQVIINKVLIHEANVKKTCLTKELIFLNIVERIFYRLGWLVPWRLTVVASASFTLLSDYQYFL